MKALALTLALSLSGQPQCRDMLRRALEAGAKVHAQRSVCRAELAVERRIVWVASSTISRLNRELFETKRELAEERDDTWWWVLTAGLVAAAFVGGVYTGTQIRPQ